MRSSHIYVLSKAGLLGKCLGFNLLYFILSAVFSVRYSVLLEERLKQELRSLVS